MNDPTIICPHCKGAVHLTEAMAAPLVEATRKQFQQQIAEKDAAIALRENAILKRESDVADARRSIEAEVANKLKESRQEIAAEEAERARKNAAHELESKAKAIADLEATLKDRSDKLAEAQNAQADLIRKGRDLEEAQRALELTVEQRVQASLDDVREKSKAAAEQALGLKIAEKDMQIDGMLRQIEELKRRAEQGSQQLQGEVQELQLEALLRTKFPMDTVQPVPKGEYGGDVLHAVSGPLGERCGTILWETKRTKNWSDGWLVKLRADMRAAKAEAALIVSQTLPKGVETFDLVDGVWVTDMRCAIPVAIAVRYSLIELAMARRSLDGQQTKMELVYAYLTGPRFRQRVEAIVERFSDMQSDLDKERKGMTRLWAKREQQIKTVIEATVGMYGDLQGIGGTKLLEIPGLELPLIEVGG